MCKNILIRNVSVILIFPFKFPISIFLISNFPNTITWRERITITIREDLLRALDNTIDYENIRNRSHALKSILTKNFSSPVQQALILTSGKKVKIRPFTYEIPKPLIPVNDKPLIAHSLSLLSRHGIHKIFITVSHLANKVQQKLKDGSRPDLIMERSKYEAPS